MISDNHSRYEELAALAAGGFLSVEEAVEFAEHTQSCTECQQVKVVFAAIVRSGLPLTEGILHQRLGEMKVRPESGARERFLQRARSEGIRFSPDVERNTAPRSNRSRLIAAVTSLAALAVAATITAVYVRFPALKTPSSLPHVAQAGQQDERLERENSALKTQLAEEHQSADSKQQQIEQLRAQLDTTAKLAESDARDNAQLRAQAEQQASRNAELLAQFQNSAKLLADAKTELAQLDQRHDDDQASTVAERVRINDLTEQLRVANANLDVDRQLVAQGKDVRDLMGARQLHVVDVRDTDPNGKAAKAFGRVFLTEGKSLIFYAFDLNENKLANSKRTFQVWGQQEGKPASLHSLGLLYVDNKADRRWALKVDNPDLVKEIDSVFVTVEPSGGGKKPSGERMLYAYLGEANHP